MLKLFNHLKTLMILVLYIFIVINEVNAATIQATSCSRDDVASAISKAADGDTISIPSGAATWSSSITINSSSSRTKMVKLIGAGTDASTGTRITANVSGPGTIFNIWLSRSLSGLEISNIRFIQGVSDSDDEDIWCIALRGHADDYDSLFRIHHCVFVQKGNSYQNSIVIGGANSYSSPDNGHPYIWGLFDNNTWTGGLSFQSVDIMPRYDTASNGVNIVGCSSNCNLGHLAWRDWTIADHQGTWKNVIFEDNIWTSTGIQTAQAALDAGCGGAFVVRHNVFRNNWISGHGPDTGGGARGTKWTEIYANEFITDANSAGWVMANGFKSGTGVNYDNTYWDYSHKGTGNPKSITGNSNFSSPAVMLTYRRADQSYGANPCQSSACGDESSSSCDNMDSSSDPGKGHICWDQTGARKGNSSNDTLGYTFVQEPVVFWNNTWADTTNKVSPQLYADSDNLVKMAEYIQERREYIKDTSCAGHMGETICSTFWDAENNKKNGYTAYAYPHTIRRPNPPTGVRIE